MMQYMMRLLPRDQLPLSIVDNDRNMSRRKKILISIVALIVVLLLWQHKLIYYGIVQAKGQIHIITNTTPVSTLLADPQVPDSLKKKLRLVEAVKKFAVDSLGINPSENYTSVFDQQGKPIMWVVSVCYPYELKAKEWRFPIVGGFSYKGFFKHNMAVEEENIWKKEGLDTNIRTTGGWSTLGWFKDPILSNMLERSDGDLAELIIHELTHGTLFVKDSLQFNENLATFIGTKGAELFLAQYYSPSAPQLVNYLKENEDSERFTNHILNGALSLDSLYQSFTTNDSKAIKHEKKYAMISTIFKEIDTLSLHNKDRYLRYFKNFEANNTYFMSFLRYKEKQGTFEETLEKEFQGDLRAYLHHLKSIYPSL